jgi:hypothetical protein
MARLITTDGMDATIAPQQREFTNEELHTLIDCTFLSSITFGGGDDLFMFVDDNGAVDGKPVNRLATRLVQEHRPGDPYAVYGDVVIVSRRETGDDD